MERPAGVISTTAAADTSHLTALGVIQNSADGSTAGEPLYGNAIGGGALGLFDGYAPLNTDLLIKFTYYGDANLDGKVDGSDFARLDSGYLNALTGWYNGDFNYDGVINGSDYTLIDNAFNTQGATLASSVNDPAVVITSSIATPTVVPEFSQSMLLLAAGIAGTQLSRRRSRMAFA